MTIFKLEGVLFASESWVDGVVQCAEYGCEVIQTRDTIQFTKQKESTPEALARRIREVTTNGCEEEDNYHFKWKNLEGMRGILTNEGISNYKTSHLDRPLTIEELRDFSKSYHSSQE